MVIQETREQSQKDCNETNPKRGDEGARRLLLFVVDVVSPIFLKKKGFCSMTLDPRADLASTCHSFGAKSHRLAFHPNICTPVRRATNNIHANTTGKEKWVEWGASQQQQQCSLLLPHTSIKSFFFYRERNVRPVQQPHTNNNNNKFQRDIYHQPQQNYQP